MAIYHLSVKSVSRAPTKRPGRPDKPGRSAVAAAAYRSGERLTNERDGRTHDYRRKAGVVSSTLLTPEGSPDWSRSELWNAAEQAEKRRDAKVAREWELALPVELDDQQRQKLAEDYGRWLVDRYGIAVDVAIHRPGSQGDSRNHHAHLLGSTRVFGPDGFGAKTRQLDQKQTASREVEKCRRAWADMVNAALGDHEQQKAKAENRDRRAIAGVEHKSHFRTNNERMPTRHMGPAQRALEKQGIQTATGDVNRQALALNSQIDVRELVERRDQMREQYDQARARLDAITRQQTEAHRQAGVVGRAAISLGLKPMPMQQQKAKAEKKARRASTALKRVGQRLDRVRSRSRDLMRDWLNSRRGQIWQKMAAQAAANEHARQVHQEIEGRMAEQQRRQEQRAAEKAAKAGQTAQMPGASPGQAESRKRRKMQMR